MASQHNPYQAPLSSSTVPAPPRDSSAKIRAVGKAQRLVNNGILMYLLLIAMSVTSEFALVADRHFGQSIVSAMFPLIALAIFIFLLVAVGRLAHALHGIGNAVIYCLCLLIPCVGLIPLLFLNARATRYLKKNGVKVGLLGAKVSSLP